MITIVIIFFTVYLITRIPSIKQYISDTFLSGFFFTILITIGIASLINVVSILCNEDEVYCYEPVVEEYDIDWANKKHTLLQVDGVLSFNVSDSSRVILKTDSTNECRAYKYISIPDSTLSMKWLINWYPNVIDSVVVYNIDKLE